MISIHALREEGDHPCIVRNPAAGVISIHALREEGDSCTASDRGRPRKFLSTPSARRATRGVKRILRASLFLSTPSARRATAVGAHVAFYKGISIHALREEGDIFEVSPAMARLNFYPRPPRGGRLWSVRTTARPTIFLSTPSARRATSRPEARRRRSRRFLSTPSARRATNLFTIFRLKLFISIHALREEGDTRKHFVL